MDFLSEYLEDQISFPRIPQLVGCAGHGTPGGRWASFYPLLFVRGSQLLRKRDLQKYFPVL